MPDTKGLGGGPLNYYRVLDIQMDADQHDVRVAYRRLAKQFHPDRNRSPLGRRLMLVVNEAYEALKTPERRASYDRTLLSAVAAAQTSSIPGQRDTSPAPAPTQPPPPPMEVPDGPLRKRFMAARGTVAGGSARILEFGRYAGRSVNEVAALDPDYLAWFIRTPLGRPYTNEAQGALG